MNYNPYFSQTDCCGDGYISPDCVMLLRHPRRIVKYNCAGFINGLNKPCQAGVSTASLRKPVRNTGYKAGAGTEFRIS